MAGCVVTISERASEERANFGSEVVSRNPKAPSFTILEKKTIRYS